jgi:hypothetical protein
MMFGRCKGVPQGHEALSYLTKGFLRSVSAGIGLQKGLRSLVRSKH